LIIHLSSKIVNGDKWLGMAMRKRETSRGWPLEQ
jgi:hypothetical protein